MLNINEYFNGQVKSISLHNNEGNATVGVIAAGEFEFGTATIELMTIISGDLDVLLPGETLWMKYEKGSTFRVEKDNRFKVKASSDCAYLCVYI